MEIRKSRMADLPEILKLYEEARAFMQETGNGTQWGTSYPPVEQVETDIREEKAMSARKMADWPEVLFFRGPDPDYAEIYEGSWMGSGDYDVMHRVAAPGARKGRRFFLHPLVRGTQPGICGSIPTGIIFPCSMCWKRTDLPDVASFIWPMERNGWPLSFCRKTSEQFFTFGFQRGYGICGVCCMRLEKEMKNCAYSCRKR